MLVHDFNGSGDWTRDAILARYERYRRALKLPESRDLKPDEHSNSHARWVYPVMDKVIEGIEAGDRACVALGLDFIEQDQGFTFGRILKANTARALRRAQLDEAQVERVRNRVLGMLAAGNVPREFRQYARLLRSIGVGPRWPDFAERVPRANRYAMRWLDYLDPAAANRPKTHR